MYRLLFNQDPNRLGRNFFRTMAICICCCLAVSSRAQTAMKNSSVAKDTPVVHNNLQLKILHSDEFDFTISPVFPPPEYKYFDNDPIELFTRIGLRASANFRYNPQPWKDPAFQNDHLFSVNYGFLRKTM